MKRSSRANSGLRLGILTAALLLTPFYSHDGTPNTEGGLGEPYFEEEEPVTLVDRQDISRSLGPVAHKNEFPDHLEIVAGEISLRVRVDYTLDQGLHDMLAAIYKRYRPDYACFVAMDPDTGAVLTLTSYMRANEDWGNLALRSVYPAASVFKMVTATAAMDSGLANPDTVVPFNGKSTTLYKKQVLQHKDNKWTRYPTLKEAFAKSMNPVFGRLGVFTIGGENLANYAVRFGFNRPLNSDLDIDQSIIRMTFDDQWSIAEASSGFTRDINISPVHAASMAGSVINGGQVMEPFVVNTLMDGQGLVLYENEPGVISRSMDAGTTDQLRKLMQQTVKSGSARTSFSKYDRSGPLKEIEVGGKTGSLTGMSPRGRHDWFVGYGVAGDGRKIAFASLIINKEKWYVRSSYIARKFLEHYFTTTPPPVMIQAAQQVSQLD
jgi:cell division protein FtsI/penicillin-binding protein 2